ncbi:hypothetical protein KY310_02110, partial [Candidatus Woesearchaeota archaeon]|nr:hypothetical protein [Candidatus Woesearchaeota archaeon]
MVSGRHKAYERAEPQDSLTGDARTDTYSIKNVIERKDAVKTRASIEIAGRTFKRGSITKLVRSLRKIPDMHTELPYFNGK